ncbi:MAG: hypothetical protein PHW32_04550, partial [Bacilli bacterium]|nr:hypothetical protein [Bacilli bacterium]
FVIAVPVIGNVINKSRYGVFGSSKKGIERAAELYYASNSKDIAWENDIGYVEVGTLKSKKYLKSNLINTLDNLEISDDTKVLLYRKNNKIEYSLQLYNEIFFDWYQEKMIAGSQKNKDNLPINIGDTKTMDLNLLMEEGLTDELRLPLNLEERCVGYVEIEKTGNDKYEYNAYVDCLTEASSFASHYVSYGGKYLDEFNDVKETSDGGFIAVGRSNSEVITKYGTGNNGKYDAIIVKFNSSGEVEWSKNFGGSNDDIFNSVVEGSNGYVAVGQTSSDDGDIEDYKGGLNDGIIVSYNHDGEIIYKRSYGGSGSNANGSESFNAIIFDNGYIIVGTVSSYALDGDLENTDLKGQSDGIILKLDLDYNQVWRNFFKGSSQESIRNIIKSKNNNYIVVGASASNNHDMEGIGYETAVGQREAIILEYSLTNGELINKKSFKGSNAEYFFDVSALDDGYVAVGRSLSNDYDMTGLSKANNGYNDAIIVKYDTNLNLVWKKSFGGSNEEEFTSIEKINNNEIVAIGYSKSNDIDMQNLSVSDDGYSNAIMVKYNSSNGNIIDKKVFGGNNSERFTNVTKIKNNELLLSGISYSINKDLKNFNKGHQDAVIVKYDTNLNLKKNLQEQVVLIDKLKEIQANYGNIFSLKYDNIYTTNDPSKDLLGWCSSREFNGNNNYDYGQCLAPFNLDDKKLLTAMEKGSKKQVFAGENEYEIDNEPDSITNWYQIYFTLMNSGSVTMSNLKLKFSDEYVGSIRESIDNEYIEPLVIVSNVLIGLPHSDRTYRNPIDIVETGGVLEDSTYPLFYLTLKSKEKKIESLIFTSNIDITGTSGGFTIHELRNFDMSIIPTN